MKAPCLNCKNRTIYCHSSCSKYIDFRDSIDKTKSTKADVEFSDYLYSAIDRMKGTRA